MLFMSLMLSNFPLSGLGMENIGGIFVVLICGLIIAVFVAIMEFVWSTRRSAETDEVCPHTCPRRPHRHTPVGSHGIPPTLLITLFCVCVCERKRDWADSSQLLPPFVCVCLYVLWHLRFGVCYVHVRRVECLNMRRWNAVVSRTNTTNTDLIFTLHVLPVLEVSVPFTFLGVLTVWHKCLWAKLDGYG